MFVQILLSILVFISLGYCDSQENYFVRADSHDQLCSIMSTDGKWAHCVLNQSQPLRFQSQSSFDRTLINVTFVIKSVSNITLPKEFFARMNDDKDLFDRFAQRTIRIDATQDPQIERIHISADAFSRSSIQPTIQFLLHTCGHPMLVIDRHAFRQSFAREILVTYDQNRTVSLQNFFADECLSDESTLEYINHDLMASDKFFITKYSIVHMTKVIVDGILLLVLILLTALMMYLVKRQHKKRFRNYEKLLRKTLASPYSATREDIPTSRTSTVISTTGSTTSGMSRIR